MIGRIAAEWRGGAGLPLRSRIARLTYPAMLALFKVVVFPLVNAVMIPRRRTAFEKGSVLHVSFMVHIPWETTRILRRHGMKADYLAVGPKSKVWDKFDFHVERDPASVWRELRFFWRVVSRYEIVHCHFGITPSRSGWELPVLRRMGRKVVVHFRGCEARNRERNMALHPAVNICQECDYDGRACREPAKQVARAKAAGDLFFVTTPDMKDFVPDAIHFPFFSPDSESSGPRRVRSPGEPLRIVHVTNHPGIEGTRHLREAVEHLRARGKAVELRVLSDVTPEAVRDAIRSADVTAGKLKMGYYANAQIESLFEGVPAITYVRPELITPELERSGLILTDLDRLEATIERLVDQPEELAAKAAVARDSARRLHDNDRLATELIAHYESLRRKRTHGS